MTADYTLCSLASGPVKRIFYREGEICAFRIGRVLVRGIGDGARGKMNAVVALEASVEGATVNVLYREERNQGRRGRPRRRFTVVLSRKGSRR